MERKNWTDQENANICAAYFYILERELRGEKVNKSMVRKNCLAFLNDRSAGSYEMKMCNISAYLDRIHAPFIKGYKPRGHAQKSLETAINAVWRYGSHGIRNAA